MGYVLLWLALDVATENINGELGVSLLYAPAGLSFALLLVRGVRYAPAVAFTMLVHDLLFRGGTQYPLWLLLSLPVAQTLVWVAPTVVLVRWIRMDPRLSRMRDLLYFVGVGCLVAPFVASVTGVGGYALGGDVPWSGLIINILGGWAGEATGAGVVTTLVLVALRPYPSAWSGWSRRLAREGRPPPEPLEGFSLPRRQEIPELLGQAALLAVVMFVAYGTDRGVRLDFAYLVFLPLIWVAIRNDLARTTICVLLINVGAALLVGGTVEKSNPILIQFGLMTLTIVGLLLGGLVTERRETSARMVREASHDRLTGLPGRALFMDVVSETLHHGSGGAFAVLAVDLDRFAEINDALGYRTGDGLLVAVAARLSDFTNGLPASGLPKASTREPTDPTNDPSTPRTARIGGDSFAVLVEEMDSEGRAEHVAGRLLEELALPYEVSGREVYVTVCAGVVVAGEAPEETEDLLRDADTALQTAKKRGPSHYMVFDRNMGKAARKRLTLDTELRRAMEREELTLYYQPVLALETNTVMGVEALVRWEHPERGLLLPAEFIPFAEQSGLIVPIGEWVLREACRWARGSREENPSKRSPVAVSVNLSAKQLERPNFSELVRTTLRETGLDPSKLILEITESVLVDGTDLVRETLGHIRGDGVRLAIDDFGTGYSSLSYLSRLPVDIIKIDRSFINGISRDKEEENSADEKLLSGIIGLAHDQEKVVVAEGVENNHQLECLRKMNCDMIQGYCFSEPLAGEMVSPLLGSVGNNLQ